MLRDQAGDLTFNVKVNALYYSESLNLLISLLTTPLLMQSEDSSQPTSSAGKQKQKTKGGNIKKQAQNPEAALILNSVNANANLFSQLSAIY